MNEWLRVMLEEVRRKQAEQAAERSEHRRREHEPGAGDDARDEASRAPRGRSK